MIENIHAKNRTIAGSLLLLAAIALASFFPALRGAYVYDDKAVILDVPAFREPLKLNEMFTRDYYDTFGERTYRPVATLTFFVDSLLWKMQPKGAHAFNICLHVLTAWAVFAALVCLLGHRGALFGAAIFAAHPLHSEAVALCSNREELLCALFFFTALYLFLLWKQKQRNTIPLLALFTASFTMAMFSKEMAASLPLVIFLHDVLFRGRGAPLIKTVRKSLPFYISSAGIVGLFLVFRYTLLSNFAGNADYPGGSAAAAIPIMARVFFQYIRLMFVPTSLCAEHVILPVSGLSAIAVLGLIAFLAMGVALIRRLPAVSFSMLFAFMAWLPISNIIPFGETMAERYAYIPSFSVCVLAAWLGAKIQWPWVLRTGIAAIIVALFAFLSMQRSRVWDNDISLWSDSVKCEPLSSRAHHNLGNALAMKGKYQEALNQYDRAGKCPVVPAPHELAYNRGLALKELGRLDEAEAAFRESLRLKSDNEFPHYQLGALAEAQGKNSTAAAHYRKAIKINPENARSYYIAGRHKMMHARNRDDLRQAFYWLNISVELAPLNAEAHTALGYVLIQYGHRKGAIDKLRTALYLDPNNPQAEELLEQLNVAPEPADSIDFIPLPPSPWKAWLFLAFIFFSIIILVMYTYYLVME